MLLLKLYTLVCVKNNKDVRPFNFRLSSNSNWSCEVIVYKIYLVKAFTYSGVRVRRQAIWPSANKQDTRRSFESPYFKDCEMKGSTLNIKPSFELIFITSDKNVPNHLMWSSPFTSRAYLAQRQNTKPFDLEMHFVRVYLSILCPW